MTNATPTETIHSSVVPRAKPPGPHTRTPADLGLGGANDSGDPATCGLPIGGGRAQVPRARSMEIGGVSMEIRRVSSQVDLISMEIGLISLEIAPISLKIGLPTRVFSPVSGIAVLRGR